MRMLRITEDKDGQKHLFWTWDLTFIYFGVGGQECGA